MDGKVKVSVILPVYNVEQYIEKCLDSLKAQTLEDLEFIFVDDRSPDSSMKIVKAAAKEDPRIRIIINEKNMGAGPSRNRGIEAARGEYLSFIDPDDYLAVDFYEILYRAARDNDVDVVKGHCVAVDEEGNVDGSWWSCENRLKKDLKEGEPLFYCFNNEHFSALFRRSLFVEDPKLRYADTRVGEDSVFILSLCLKDPSFVMEENAVYYHLIRQDSLIGSLSYDNVDEGMKALDNRIEVLKEASFPEGWVDYTRVCVEYYIGRFRRVYRADEDDRKRTKRLHAFYKEMERILARIPEAEKVTDGNKTYEELLKMENSKKKKTFYARAKRKIKRILSS